MAKKFKITNLDRLKMMKKAMRETTHLIKPMTTTDRKKQANKMACRKKDKFE